MDVNLEELDQIIERGTHTPLSATESEKLKLVLHALAAMLPASRTTEKTKNVLEQSAAPAPEKEPEPAKGHGRNGACSYTGAKKVRVSHPQLHAGDACPGCEEGKIYPQKEPRTLVRVVGQAPLAATVYELDRLRCNLCGEVFTAPEPEGIGPEKYDETTAAMIALLKYGSGMPFYRLEKLEQALGIPLPASTQWEIVEDEAELIQAARDELIRQAAQGEVLHNDDTSMRVLRLAREPAPGGKADRTGVFTSGIVSTQQGRRIALYFTGRQHAGENLRDVLQHRSADLARPLQMCDALSRNTPKLSDGAEILLAHCLAHGRRQFVEVAANFPEPCRYVLETLGDVYKYDAQARERHLSAPQRLQFHQQHSGPVMEQLHQWLEAQFALKQVEPNSGLGKAITYLLRHWKGLTAFLREAGAPLDNNICERALKRAVLHRKNALFYRTLHGAEAGDLFMSLIHTCELAGANPFDYLTELQRHSSELAANPSAWMPWNYVEQTQPGHNH
ncbi:MAG TPA: IS66 family transposase [Bryobacteraceae bacterium]|jgi:transposase